MITTIIFDWGGVLGSNDNSWDTNFKDILALTELSKSQIEGIWKALWDGMKIGAISVSSFWEEVCKHSPNKIKKDKLTEIYNANITINSSMLDIVTKLKSSGYKLGVLANSTREWFEVKTTKFHLDQYFDSLINSADIGVAKPNPRSYLYALNELGASPNQVVFIDDVDRNVHASNELGINSILFRSVDLLINDLQKLRVEVIL